MMAPPKHLRILTFLTALSIPAAAQDRTALPVPNNLPAAIPIADADRHLVHRQVPAYPPLAKAARFEGVVRLKLLVDPSGTVTQVLDPSGPPLLVRAAIEAAHQYRYRPFEVAGAPGSVVVEAAVSFLLISEAPSQPIPFPAITDLASVVIEYANGFVSLRVSGTGLVEYDGAAEVAIEGKHRRYIGSDDVERMLQAFRDADFFSLRDDYTVGATDVGQTRTFIRVGALQKNITDDWVRVPPVLKSVQEAVLKFSHSDQWVKGNAETVPGIVAEGPNTGVARETLSEILPRAAYYGDTDVVRAILAKGAELERHGVWDGTALMHAAERGLPDMVAVLLAAGANPLARDKEGRGALMFGARSGNSKVVELLLAAGANASERDRCRDTALMAAAAAGNPDSVRILLDRGARVNAKNRRRQTALLSASSGDDGFAIGEMGRQRAEIPDEIVHRSEVVRMLVQAGADINSKGWSGETALFSLEDDAVKELLHYRIDVESRDQYGETALMETVSDRIADLLIRAGANVNAEDKKGQTALIRAAERNYADKLTVLVKASGIRLEHHDRNGVTALMAARKAGHQDCVHILVAAGATM
jgi:TonB family protein